MCNFKQRWLSDFPAQGLETDDDSWQQEEISVTVPQQLEELKANWITRKMMKKTPEVVEGHLV